MLPLKRLTFLQRQSLPPGTFCPAARFSPQTKFKETVHGRDGMEISGTIDGPAGERVRHALTEMLDRLDRDGVPPGQAKALLRAELEAKTDAARSAEEAPPSPDKPMRDEPANDWPAAGPRHPVAARWFPSCTLIDRDRPAIRRCRPVPHPWRVVSSRAGQR